MHAAVRRSFNAQTTVTGYAAVSRCAALTPFEHSPDPLGAEPDAVSGLTIEGLNPHSGRPCALVAEGEKIDIERDAAAARVALDKDPTPTCFEVTRLARLATFVRHLTEDVLRRAGVERGMRVLDLGCGIGDTSLSLAKLVGPLWPSGRGRPVIGGHACSREAGNSCRSMLLDAVYHRRPRYFRSR
jgi:hypothetical protein